MAGGVTDASKRSLLTSPGSAICYNRESTSERHEEACGAAWYTFAPWTAVVWWGGFPVVAGKDRSGPEVPSRGFGVLAQGVCEFPEVALR